MTLVDSRPASGHSHRYCRVLCLLRYRQDPTLPTERRAHPRTGPARRSRRERGSHHGFEKRALAHARRRFKRKNGRFWRAQFCTEVARPKRFELLTPRFVVWCSRTERPLIVTPRLEPRPAGQARDWFAEPAQRALCATTALLLCGPATNLAFGIRWSGSTYDSRRFVVHENPRNFD
jgi:hypothetical protein